jgi:adenylate cyclase
LVDLGSSNGTLLNGHRTRQPVALKDKDRVEIGRHLFIYRHTGSALQASLSGGAGTMTIKATETSNRWLLVADIEKFTALSQTLPGDELAKYVGTWISACQDVIEKHSGEINQYLGDGFLAYWPANETNPDSIASTLAELRKIQDTNPVKFRWVVHYGSITVDRALSQGQNSLIGPNVNFIFRMEKVAGGLGQSGVLSEPAAKNLGLIEKIPSLGAHPLSGFSGTHALYAY